MVRAGDFIWALSLLLTIAYLVLVYGHFAGWYNLTAFGANWAADGFCISFKGTYYDTHLLCFYTNTAWTILFLFLAHLEKDRPWISGRLTQTAPSVFMHGAAHGFLSYQMNQYGGLEDGTAIQGFRTPIEKVIILVIFLAGFFAFVHKQASSNVLLSLLQACFHVVVSFAFIPPKFGFTYVNTVVSLNMGLAAMLGNKGSKDVFYDLSSCLHLVILLTTWFEPLACDSFLINWGGHAWFDNSITVGTFMFYIAGRILPPPKGMSKVE